MTEPLRVVIVDDDLLARRRIHDLLAGVPDVVVQRECSDGTSAVSAILAEPTDLVFLDVQMPGLDGFDVVAEVGAAHMPHVVFTSAYAEFAIRAFEAYALDYLLKPFDDERFTCALDRARQRIAEERNAEQAVAVARGTREPAIDPRLLGLLEYLDRPPTPHYPEAIAVKSADQYVVIRVEDIGNYAKVYAQKRPRLVARSLATLERDVLDPTRFVRVHRSAIVNVRKVVAVESLFHGDVSLALDDGTHVQCSRRYRKQLEERLYFTT